MCVFVGHVSARSSKTSWKQRVNIRGSCRVSWARTCAHFTPQTGRVIHTLACMLQYNLSEYKNTHVYVTRTDAAYHVHTGLYIIFISLVSSPLFCRLSSVDISHIQGNLEEISTFQQMLVQSLEEHTRSVSFCRLQMVF